MRKKIILFFALCALLTGCYEAGPTDDAQRTIPITNNPNAMPGPMKASPMPNSF
jgi:hypothetical protein